MNEWVGGGSKDAKDNSRDGTQTTVKNGWKISQVFYAHIIQFRYASYTPTERHKTNTLCSGYIVHIILYSNVYLTKCWPFSSWAVTSLYSPTKLMACVRWRRMCTMYRKLWLYARRLTGKHNMWNFTVRACLANIDQNIHRKRRTIIVFDLKWRDGWQG